MDSENGLPMLSGPLGELVANLKLFLDGGTADPLVLTTTPKPSSDVDSDDEVLAVLLPSEASITPVRSKRQRDDSPDECCEGDDIEQAAKMKFGYFEFECQGTRVAVYYDDDYYIGEVVEVTSKTSGNITFMAKCGLKKKSLYRWPVVVNIDNIDSRFVIDWDFNMTTTNGRMWAVEDEPLLQKMYKQYK
ncbi:hypothetical protein ScPMuIL_009358 [Solemya velum]